jgi:hypothetical protein
VVQLNAVAQHKRQREPHGLAAGRSAVPICMSARIQIRPASPIPPMVDGSAEPRAGPCPGRDRPGPKRKRRAGRPADPVELAVRAVFVAADSDIVMNLEPVLELVKAATGMGADYLVPQVCAGVRLRVTPGDPVRHAKRVGEAHHAALMSAQLPMSGVRFAPVRAANRRC